MKPKNFGRTKLNNSRDILSFIKRNKKEIKISVIVGIILFPLGILQFICQVPIQSLVEQSPKFLHSVRSLFATPPSVEIKRSLFNNMFSFVKSSKNRDSIVVHGINTTYQAWVKVKNNSEEELLLRGAKITDKSSHLELAKRDFGFSLKPLDSVTVTVETKPLFGNESIVRVIEKGQLLFILDSNFGEVSKQIDCICFFNGRKMPNAKILYTIGTDTTCIEFELNDPEGLKATGNPEVVQ